MRNREQPTLAKSWSLFKRSGAVMLKDPELPVFPVFSSLALALLIYAMNVKGLLAVLIMAREGGLIEWISIYLAWVVGYFLVLFSNAALIGAALKRFQGGDPDIAYGLKVATMSAPRILVFATLSATVGMVLRFFAARTDGLGRLAVELAGYTWGMAVFFVVPVMIVERVGPIQAILQSAPLLKSTWGEQLVGIWGLGMVGMVVFLFVFVFGSVASVIAAELGSQPLGAFFLLLIPATLVVLLFVCSVLNAAYRAALYHYAQGGSVPGSFTDEMVAGAFAGESTVD